MTEIVEWMQASRIPTLMEFSDDFADIIFAQKKKAVVLVREPEDEEKNYSVIFEETAKQMKGDIIFVISTLSDGAHARLAAFLEVTAADVPIMKIIDPEDDDRKYTYPANLTTMTAGSLKQWITDFKNKKLIPIYKSE